MSHVPAKIIVEAATSPAARRAVAIAQLSLTPTINEQAIDGRPVWCNYKVYKMVVAAAVLLCRPANFLEIGVRRGHGLATAAVVDPAIGLVGVDPWLPDYAGEPNPGPDFVRRELKKVGHTGELQLYQAFSREFLPKFIAAGHTGKFSLIGVDGSHDADDAKADLELSLQLLAVGGILIFDDVHHPAHPGLKQVWEECSKGYERHESDEHGYGVAVLRKN